MKLSFRAYTVAGLGITLIAILLGPVATNLFLDARTLLTSAIVLLLGEAGLALWMAGPDERRARFVRWLLAGFATGALTALMLMLAAGIGYFLAIGVGLSYGAFATMGVAFAAAGLVIGSSYLAHWLAWRVLVAKPQASRA